MRLRILLTVVATAAVGLAVPSTASTGAAPKIDGSVTVSYIVPTRDAQIYLEVVKPTAAGRMRPGHPRPSSVEVGASPIGV